MFHIFFFIITYIEKSKILSELEEIEYENNKVVQKIEQKLLDLDPDQKSEYEQIREDNQNYIMKIYQLREEMAKLNADLIEGENNVKEQPLIVESIKETESVKIQVQIKNYADKELEWWKQFGISKRNIKKFNWRIKNVRK